MFFGHVAPVFLQNLAEIARGISLETSLRSKENTSPL
jgi:hypothetical protein